MHEGCCILREENLLGGKINELLAMTMCLSRALRQNPPPAGDGDGDGDGDGQGEGPPPEPPVLVAPITTEQLSAFTTLQPTLRGVSQRNSVVWWDGWPVSPDRGEFWNISMLNNSLQLATFCQYRNG